MQFMRSDRLNTLATIGVGLSVVMLAAGWLLWPGDPYAGWSAADEERLRTSLAEFKANLPPKTPSHDAHRLWSAKAAEIDRPFIESNRRRAVISTVLLATGGVGLVAGLIVWQIVRRDDA